MSIENGKLDESEHMEGTAIWSAYGRLDRHVTNISLKRQQIDVGHDHFQTDAYFQNTLPAWRYAPAVPWASRWQSWSAGPE